MFSEMQKRQVFVGEILRIPPSMEHVGVPPWFAAPQACGVPVPLIVSDVSGGASQHSATANIRSLGVEKSGNLSFHCQFRRVVRKLLKA